MKCKKCGRENGIDSRFCGGCGAILVSDLCRDVCPLCESKLRTKTEKAVSSPLMSARLVSVLREDDKEFLTSGPRLLFFFPKTRDLTDLVEYLMQEYKKNTQTYDGFWTMTRAFVEISTARLEVERCSSDGQTSILQTTNPDWEVVDTLEVSGEKEGARHYRSLGPDGLQQLTSSLDWTLDFDVLVYMWNTVNSLDSYADGADSEGSLTTHFKSIVNSCPGLI